MATLLIMLTTKATMARMHTMTMAMWSTIREACMMITLTTMMI